MTTAQHPASATTGSTSRPLAVITGASSGIGLELANEFARHGFDLVVAAESGIEDAGPRWTEYGAAVERVSVDLTEPSGVEELFSRVEALGRPIDAVAINAFLASFSTSLREELRGSGVTVTALMPGPTATDFFRRASMTDTKIGAGPKDSAVDVGRAGFAALMAGREHVIPGVRSKVMAAAGKVLPDVVAARMHRLMSAPGSAR